MSAHYFVFSRNWTAGDPEQRLRLCGDCKMTYDDGEHIEITTLKPYTKYVCPNDNGEMGHSSCWTGAHRPELRTLHGHLCVCGAEFVEEDTETWQLSWEMQTPDAPWHPVSVVRSRHAAETQRTGLLKLIEQGEEIRNVRLVKLVEDDADQDDDELEECTGCGLRAPADDLAECVNHIPMHGRGPFHCHDCVNSGCCGGCQDEAAREWQAEHGGHR